MTPGDSSAYTTLPASGAYSLFTQFPFLESAVPRTPLGSWPTPVESLAQLADVLDIGGLQVKHDDLSAIPYGGNKVRKLEVLLGDAVARGTRHVITFGAAGSNHALATAIYGRRLGLDVTSFLMPQPNATYVRRNLLAHRAVGARVSMHATKDAAVRAAALFRSTTAAASGIEPYVIPFGGTSPLSTVGVVNAGLEFALQVAAGDAVAPDFVYVPLGSMGTAVGVALGLALGGLKPIVRAVQVVPEAIADARKTAELARETARILELGDRDFPRSLESAYHLEIVNGFLGEEYARFTPEGMEAIALATAEAGLHLEGTYSGKTMAALVSAARSGELSEANVLFWDTYNSHDLGPLVDGVDYRDLPEECHVFFETAVQPLDRTGT